MSILVVDDEPLIGSLIRKTLVGLGEVKVDTDVAATIAALERGIPVSAILCDLHLPGGSRMLHNWVTTHRPELVERIGYISGGAYSDEAQSFLDDVRPPFLAKPFTRGELLEFCRALLPTAS